MVGWTRVVLSSLSKTVGAEGVRPRRVMGDRPR